MQNDDKWSLDNVSVQEVTFVSQLVTLWARIWVGDSGGDNYGSVSCSNFCWRIPHPTPCANVANNFQILAESTSHPMCQCCQ